MFGLKRVVGTLLSPLALGGLFGVVGVLLLLRERSRRIGVGILAALVVAGFPLGTTPVADALIRPLEERVPALLDPGALAEDVEWVVVLGHGFATDPRISTTARLGGEALFRVVEGIRIHRALSDSRLVFTGWGGARPAGSSAEAGADAALALGVPEERLVRLDGPRDTEEEARAVAELVGPGARVVLVTSAAHMPRALRHFEAEGLRPVPAPAHHYAPRGRSWTLGDFLPSARNYRKVERAVHEYMGLTWAWLRRR